MLEEGAQELELARAELDRLAADAGPAGAQVERDVADPQLRLLGAAVAAAQLDPDPRDQLLEVKRLRQVVVGAALEPLDAVVRVAAGGEHDHRQPLAGVAQVAQDVEAVLAAAGSRSRISRSKSSSRASDSAADPVADDGGREAARAQALLEEGGEARLVLGDEDPAHGAATGSAGRTIVKVAPSPGRESSSTRPPCASAIACDDREPEAGARPGSPSVPARS